MDIQREKDEMDAMDYQAEQDNEVYADEICDCGGKKRINELYCHTCQKAILDEFKEIMQEFSRQEIEFLNDALEGEYLPDYILGKEV